MDTNNARIQQLRPVSFNRPIATIVKATPASVMQGDTITLTGMGGTSDAGTTIAAYEWTVDGSATPFQTSATAALDTAGLAPGAHTVTLRVRDSAGRTSPPRSASLTIAPRGGTAPAWTMLLYLDGESADIEGAFTAALERLRSFHQAQRHAAVNIVALYDSPGARGSTIYRFSADGTRAQLSACEAGLGDAQASCEVNMGQSQTLIDFVRWGQQHAPAEHYALTIADHADALYGIAWDASSGDNEYLTLGELRAALETITNNGAHPLDLLHYDGCLMGTLEVAADAQGMARYLISSQNQAWSFFAYDTYARAIQPTTTPEALARAVVNGYADRANRASPPVAYTIAALNVETIAPVEQAEDNLAQAMLAFVERDPANVPLILQARSQAQKFDSNNDGALDDRDAFVDLGHLAEVLETSIADPAIQQAAHDVQTVLTAFVVQSRQRSGIVEIGGVTHDVELDHAHGISLHYPARPGQAFYQHYLTSELHMLANTRWGAMLMAVLNDQPYDDRPPAPQPIGPIRMRPATQSSVYLPLLQR